MKLMDRIYLIMLIIDTLAVIFMIIFTAAFMRYGFMPEEFMPEWARIILGL